jgi:Na+-translocating ferredoxin:NAD+ oxidoreductase RnfG subunit
MTRTVARAVLALGLAASTVGPVLAHVTPPVVLVSDREAVAGLLTGARRFFVREVKLTSEQKQIIRQRSGWTPDEDFYRFYLGREEQGRLVGAMLFVTEYTLHGPVRVAVGLGPDGKVRGATVVELTEETYPWLKRLIDQNFTRDYVGLDSRGPYQIKLANLEIMTQFYGQVMASLIQRAALLYEVAIEPAAKT